MHVRVLIFSFAFFNSVCAGCHCSPTITRDAKVLSWQSRRQRQSHHLGKKWRMITRSRSAPGTDTRSLQNTLRYVFALMPIASAPSAHTPSLESLIDTDLGERDGRTFTIEDGRCDDRRSNIRLSWTPKASRFWNAVGTHQDIRLGGILAALGQGETSSLSPASATRLSSSRIHDGPSSSSQESYALPSGSFSRGCSSTSSGLGPGGACAASAATSTGWAFESALPALGAIEADAAACATSAMAAAGAAAGARRLGIISLRSEANSHADKEITRNGET